jgi:hypothetical protein
MNFNLKSASLALVAVVGLSLPLAAQAEDNSARVFLGIESVCGQRAHIFDIRNTGIVTSSAVRYRLIARASDVMPALYTWELTLFPLAPGQVFHVTAPRGAWGLRLTVEIAANANTVVTQSAQPITYPNFCW